MGGSIGQRSAMLCQDWAGYLHNIDLIYHGGNSIILYKLQYYSMYFFIFQLITTPEVIELLIVMMQSVKNEGDDRWRKISRAVTVNAMKERKKERKIER